MGGSKVCGNHGGLHVINKDMFLSLKVFLIIWRRQNRQQKPKIAGISQKEIFSLTGKRMYNSKKTKEKSRAKAGNQYFKFGVSLCLETKYMPLEYVW